jgi:choline dehydrogenase
VLVIEAGPGDLDRPQITDPSLWPTNIGSELDWSLPTVPQDRLADRFLLLSAGRVVGGSGNINAMVWLRGDKRDFHAWAEAGGPTWGFASVLRTFRRIEDFHGADGGPVPGRDAGQ